MTLSAAYYWFLNRQPFDPTKTEISSISAGPTRFHRFCPKECKEQIQVIDIRVHITQIHYDSLKWLIAAPRGTDPETAENGRERKPTINQNRIKQGYS